ncbi:MAG TPA: sulfatase [Candidatus Binatia bacterium]|jgi:arylsulfatase|nr:sulfatase [Candidatus Binatia bacterium]
MNRAGPAIAAAVAAGVAVGVGDVLITLASSPDPAHAVYRLGYVLGPILADVGCALSLGIVTALLGRGRAGGGEAIAAAVVTGAWALTLLADAWLAGFSAAALMALGLGTALVAVALARLARDVARWLYDGAPHRRWIASGATAALMILGTAVTAPSGMAAFGGGTGPCAETSAVGSPNLLLITIDSLRLDDARTMSSYRRLAARGTEFTQHVTDAPWTLPSVASLLSGVPVSVHGAGRSRSWSSLLDKTGLRGDAVTVAGILGARGYRTHAVVTNPFLTSRYGIDTGFCSFENVTMEGEAVRGMAQTVPVRVARLLAPRWLPDDRAATVRARAETWLDRRPPGAFFLWVHFLDPHAPYGDRDGASTSLTLDLMALQGEASLEAPFSSVGRLRAGEFRPGPAERAQLRALYREDVTYVDREIGRLLDGLAARGLDDDTIVLLTADHGEEFWDHGGVEHGRTLYEEVLRVPLVIAPSAHETVDRLTTVLDVAPTIIARGGTAAPTTWSGTDLLALPASRQGELSLGTLLFGEELTGLRTPTHKLVESEHGTTWLFDLAQDPGEQRNVAAADPATLEATRARMAPDDRPTQRPE